MAVIIKGPDGSPVSFPDGTDEATINNAMAQAYPKGGAASGMNPSLKEGPGDARVTPPAKPAGQPPSQSDFGLGVWEGSKMPLDNASVAIEAGLRKLGVPVDKIDGWLAQKLPFAAQGSKTGTASDIRSGDIQYLNEQRAKGRKPSVAGNIVGSIIPGAAVALATKNPLAVGGAMGALESEAPDAKGVAKDAGYGAAFGKVAQVGMRGAAALVKPTLQPVVNKLLQAGVKLTPGQLTGGTIKMVEDATSKTIPVIGDVVDQAHNRAIKSFNVAAYNRALAPLGETFPDGSRTAARQAATHSLPRSVEAGHQGVAYVQGRFQNAYGALYPKMAVEYDEPLHGDLQDIVQQAARNLPTDKARIFQNTVEDEIGRPLLTGQRGGAVRFYPSDAGQVQMPILKGIDTKLNDIHTRYAKSLDPHDQLFAQYIQNAKQAVHDAAARFNPEVAAQLKKVDQGYSALARIEPAAARAPGGIFTGSQLSQSVKNADTSVRKRATAAGRSNMQDLADAGQQVLRPAIGNSGTAARHIVGAGIGAALFGKTLGLSVNPLALGAVGAALAPYTRVGGNVVRAAISKRPPGAATVRNALERATTPASVALPIAAQRKRGS